jgi:hypothetical protein
MAYCRAVRREQCSQALRLSGAKQCSQALRTQPFVNEFASVAPSHQSNGEHETMTNLNRAKLIALDWGTSSCRAYLMGEGSVVLSERQEPSGVMAITARAGASGTPYKVAFGRAFEALCGEWLGSVPGLPVIACGMVGRNQGWVEAEYRTVPTDLAANGLVLTPVRTQAGPTVHIVPGLIVNSALPGVMRGEETQILGALSTISRQARWATPPIASCCCRALTRSGYESPARQSPTSPPA